MLAILRVEIGAFEIDTLDIPPYRIDNGDNDTAILHFDIVESEAPMQTASRLCLEALELHADDIRAMADAGGRQTLDIAVNILENQYAITLRLNDELLKFIAKNQLFVEVSVYKTS